jgi:beta-glucosidase
MKNLENLENLLTQLTLEEKIGMIHGCGIFETKSIPRLGIPPLKFSDGPMGVRNEFFKDKWLPCSQADNITYLPSGSALAATWNPDLAYKSGQVLGAEARGRGKDVILGPGINIKRTPLCGRNFEYMSEDPYLITQLAPPLIKGIQENDVAACVKHFACNNQELYRNGVDVEVDEETLREIYLPGFEACAKVSHTIMSAYNRFRGFYTSHSKELLNNILEDEWGFNGVVVSDWGAVHDTEEAARVNMDIEMSYTPDFDDYYFANPLLKAVKEERIDEALIDKKVLRILQLMEKLKMFEDTRKAGCYNLPEHRKVAEEIAAESVVLLKNDAGLLPLKNPKRILIIGDNATHKHANLGGSAELKVLYEVTPLLGLCGRLGGNTEVRYAQGYATEVLAIPDEGWASVSPDSAHAHEKALPPPEDTNMRKEAIELAKEYEQVLYIGGLNHLQDTESHDRPDMRLPYKQDELIEQLLGVNPNMIIVMIGGSAVDMSRWVGRAKTLVWAYYAGCESGHALADVLLGKINPSGKLPETFAVKLTDYAAHSIGEYPGSNNKVRYLEGNKVGYRHFDTAGIEPLFAFGHGLSYTAFELSDLKIDGSNVSCMIENTGTFKGKTVVQLYVNGGLYAFKKLELDIGEKQEICFNNVPENHKIRVGLSSRGGLSK